MITLPIHILFILSYMDCFKFKTRKIAISEYTFKRREICGKSEFIKQAFVAPDGSGRQLTYSQMHRLYMVKPK